MPLISHSCGERSISSLVRYRAIVYAPNASFRFQTSFFSSKQEGPGSKTEVKFFLAVWEIRV